MESIIKKLISSLALLGLALLASVIPLSYALGLCNIPFSVINMILPVSGALVGFWASLPVLICYFLLKKSISFSLITGGLPTFLATTNWAMQTEKQKMLAQLMLQVLLPVICMILFVVHPVGHDAFLYSSYWLIPMMLFVVQRYVQHIFFVALSSTFIAHAVGSVIWLYTIPMAAEQWLALIPLVAVERLVFALGATVFYAVAKSISDRVSDRQYKKLSRQCMHQ